jgi:hypothetical protein
MQRDDLSHAITRRLAGVVAALLLAAALPPAVAQSAPGASSVNLTLAPGWSRGQEGDIDVLTPAAASGTVQVLIMAPAPLTEDFDRQFAREREQLEQFWQLRDARPVAPQRGQAGSGPFAAWFASYDSDGGERYMSFLAQAQRGQLLMFVFVAASSEEFNRLAPEATAMFASLTLPP